MSRDRTAVSREYAPGTVLFREREPGDKMYVIRSGRVKIYRTVGDGELVLAFLTDGDFLGEMALLEGLPRSASAMVVEPSVLIEVDQATFEGMIRRNIEIAVRIMRKLASRVRAVDGRLEKLLVDNGQERALEILRWLLPQGVLDGKWIRVKGIAPHFDIAAQAGIPQAKAEDVLRRLSNAGCLRIEGDDILIAEKRVLDTYAAFLELRREYEPLTVSEDEYVQKTDQRQAMRRLMAALELSPEEIEEQQRSIVSKYERYLQLKERFKAIDG